MQDDSIHYIEGGKPLWHREEGLGRIQSTLFIDLPAATAELDAELRAARPTLVDRLNAEVLTIKACSTTADLSSCAQKCSGPDYPEYDNAESSQSMCAISHRVSSVTNFGESEPRLWCMGEV